MAAWALPRIKVEIRIALSAIYGIRMHTSRDRWSAEQVALIQRIESDIVKLRDSLE